MQYEGITAAQSLASEQHGDYSAYLPALDAAYRIGRPIVAEITEHWGRYVDHVPSGS
jgi:purine nucleoside permease